MQKKILIIGNNDGLQGVKVDIENYKGFFKSHIGGEWYDSEIITKLNPSRTEIVDEITRMKSLSLDYSIIIFSGHGGQKRETILELNSIGEKLYESELKDISKRQLTIFDCCRCYPEPLVESARGVTALLNKAFTDVGTRLRYETRIMQAIPQQANLYACSIGEEAKDSSAGGIYSKHLIQSAKRLQSTFKLVGTTHIEAAELTTIENPKQHPDSLLSKCLSEQQLIISLRP